jgi:hypothetical protein
MEVLTAMGGIGAAFGLASSAGLNAYIPLLVVALATRFPAGDPLLQLTPPYDLLGHWAVIAVLVVLMLIEMTVDKVPAVDTVNDIIQTFIRPTAGAILFAANANVITDVSPLLAIIAGVVLAGGVHAAKGAARPVVTATTAGTGNWFVSLVEDVVAFFVSLLSIVLPLLAMMLALGLLVFLVIMLRRRRRRALARS